MADADEHSGDVLISAPGGLVNRGPVLLLGVLATAAGSSGQLLVRDGNHDQAPIRLLITVAQDSSFMCEPPRPLRFPRGIFTLIDNGISGVFFIEPQDPEGAEQPPAEDPGWERRTPPPAPA